MLVVFLIIVILLLVGSLGFVTYHAYRWAKIIFVMEDKYSEVIDIHERTLDTFDKLLQMQMFFDSPQVKQTVQEVMEDVKVCRVATQKIILTLTEHSKRKFFIEEDE